MLVLCIFLVIFIVGLIACMVMQSKDSKTSEEYENRKRGN
jgi:hypothetical protein